MTRCNGLNPCVEPMARLTARDPSNGLEQAARANCTVNVYRGFHRFFLQYLWKRAVRISEKPCTPQREKLCMLWGNPVIFTYTVNNYSPL